MEPILVGYAEDGTPLELTHTRENPLTAIQVVGATRTGKSKWLEGLGRQCMRRVVDPLGFAFIDITGQTHHDLLVWLAVVQPDRDITIIDPSLDRVASLNFFSGLTGGDPHVGAAGITDVVMKIWNARSTDETPRLRKWVHGLAYLLIKLGLTTEAARLFITWQHGALRARLLERLPTDDLVREKFEELAALTRAADFTAQLESTDNRLRRLIEPQSMRRLLGLIENAVDLERIVATGGILLVNARPVDGVLSRENARTLGALLIDKLWRVAQRREVDVWGNAPQPGFLCVIDEFPEFLTPDIAPMLDQAAKFSLHLVLAHQHLAQLEELDRWAFQSEMTNARIKLCFGGLTRADAMTMVDNLFPGELDFHEVKRTIMQTKFWPVYTRDTVHASSAGGAEGTDESENEARTSSAAHTGQFGTLLHDRWSLTSASMRGTASSRFQQTNWSESVSNVPFLRPVPFREASSIDGYTLEELRWRAADRLTVQYQRNFLFRRPGSKTVSATAPDIPHCAVSRETLHAYVDRVLSRFLTVGEIDAALETQARRLLADPAAGLHTDTNGNARHISFRTRRR
jgi:hypothetical protein